MTPTKERLNKEYRAIQRGRHEEGVPLRVSPLMTLARKYKLPIRRLREIMDRPAKAPAPLACQSEATGDCEGTVRCTVNPYVMEIYGKRKLIVVCEHHYREIAEDI